MRTAIEMKRHPCRTCGAKPGEPCRALTTGKTTNPHQSRWEPKFGGDFDEVPGWADRGAAENGP